MFCHTFLLQKFLSHTDGEEYCGTVLGRAFGFDEKSGEPKHSTGQAANRITLAQGNDAFLGKVVPRETKIFLCFHFCILKRSVFPRDGECIPFPPRKCRSSRQTLQFEEPLLRRLVFSLVGVRNRVQHKFLPG